MGKTHYVPPHVVVLPSPGVGHLKPLAEFARTLHLRHHLPVTLLTLPPEAADTSQAAQQSLFDSLPPTLHAVSLPPIPTSDIPPTSNMSTRIVAGVLHSLQCLSSVLKELASSSPLVILVVDMFTMPSIDIAKEFNNVSVYLLFTSNFTTLSFFLHLPTIDQQMTGQFHDMPEPLRLPGCVPIPGTEVPEPAKDRNSEAYRLLVSHVKRYREVAGIFVNSVMEMELGPFNSLHEEAPSNISPPTIPIGPLIESGSSREEGDHGSVHCLKWLDQQPSGSVIFVSFGSGGTLTSEQMGELALGLELSRQRFLWVVRKPSEKEASAYFAVGGQDEEEPGRFLPEGFTLRTKEVGLVVPWWAPQVDVLAHRATGGFLSHCGWNSILESIVHGLPIVAWPLYAEQRINAVLLVEGMKVAIQPRAGEGGLVGREEISRVVEKVMVGEEGKLLREGVEKFKEAAARALAEDGSSHKALSQVVSKW